MSTKSDVTVPPSEGEESQVGISEMKNMMQTEIVDSTTGKRRSYWSVAMETMNMVGGKDGEGDLWLETVEQGVPMLRKYIKDKDLKLAEQQTSAKEKKPFNSYWDLVPLEEFHVTQTTFVKSFLKWAIKDREDIAEGSEEAKMVVNASKARRRMDSYFDWMADNMAEDILQNPLTLDSILETHKIWDLQSSTHEDGRYFWWFDLDKMDRKLMKKMSNQDHLRYMVWYSHLVMFDIKAQDNGIILVEDLAKIGFWNCMTLIPLDLSAKMDRLTMGVLPIKMKAIYCFGVARWFNLMMALMKPFLSKKMRERIIIVTEVIAPDRQKYCEDKFGHENIIDGFIQCHGGTKKDAAIDKFKKRSKKKGKKAAKKEEEEKVKV